MFNKLELELELFLLVLTHTIPAIALKAPDTPTHVTSSCVGTERVLVTSVFFTLTLINVCVEETESIETF